MSRLDFFLVSDDLLNFVNESEILPGYRTDHSAVTIKFSFSAQSRGKGYWKFNNSLLHDKLCIKLIKDSIDEIKQQYAASPSDTEYVVISPPESLNLQVNDQLFLEMILLHIRGKLISYTSFKKRASKEKESKIELEIKN